MKKYLTKEQVKEVCVEFRKSHGIFMDMDDVSLMYAEQLLNIAITKVIGEPVAYADGDNVDMESYKNLEFRYQVNTKKTDVFNEPLYQVKEIV
jgi:hypothetical protein